MLIRWVRYLTGTFVLTVTTEVRGQGPVSGNPPPPVAPATINRDTTGRATVRAIRLDSPLDVDGRLDEEVYAREQPFGGLIQAAPDYGEPQTEKSDIWVTFDDRNIYVTCRCHDSAPPDEWVVNELRRDTGGLRQNDHIGVMFDTFHDGRSGFGFYSNPLGARADYSMVDEGQSNSDWNPVWTSKTGRFDGGWIVEMAIPFKSLRYRAGRNQTWGMQLRRSVRRRNEWGYLTPVPQSLAGPQALNRVSSAAILVGLDLPEAGHSVEVKPYVVSRLSTDRVQTPPITNDMDGEIGGDLRFGITANLTADFTVNTDFAQVEVDEQQVNLTRFSLFFPEKREFFLEGRGIFDFGRGGTGMGGGFRPSDTPYLFYSRRIGLNNGRVVPIAAGGRVTGKVGPWGIGLMNIQTGRERESLTDPTNFSVLRLKRDVLRGGTVGMMFTNRSLLPSGNGSNQAWGADGAFQLSQDMSIGAWWARTATTGLSGKDQSYQLRANWNHDRYGADAELLSVGANFRPEVGFTRRTDFTRSYAQLRFSPRPATIPSVRKFSWSGSGEYIVNGAGTLEARIWNGQFSTEFQSSDEFWLGINHDYEQISEPFTPTGSPVAIQPGGYTFTDATAAWTFGAHRRVSGMISVQAGQYYDGTIQSLSLSGNPFSPARVVLSSHLSVEPSFTWTRIRLPAATFTTRLARARIDYAFTPLMFATTLVQYNSADHTLSTNLRFRWEYAPGSELFIVYTDERDQTDSRYATPGLVRGLRNRAFVVKLNRLFRF